MKRNGLPQLFHLESLIFTLIYLELQWLHRPHLEPQLEALMYLPILYYTIN